MTPEEIEIAFKKQLLVTVRKNSATPYLEGGVYTICRIGSYYDGRFKRFEDFAALKSSDGRTVYELSMDYVEPMPGYDIVIKNFLENRRKYFTEKRSEII